MLVFAILDAMTDSVITSVRNTTGVIELNRPKALNSLSPEMIAEIAAALEKWRDDDAVTQILVHAPERSFCAGGDVRHVRELILDGQLSQADQFFAEEYDLNLAIATHPKPYGALIDGVLMGGGQGISVHGDYRIITDQAFASMPEMAIGYITDVGMSWKLQQLDTGAAVGRFLALTGYRLTPDDMLYTGLATHLVSGVDAEAIIGGGFEAALKGALTEHGPSRLQDWREDIDAVFSHDTWEEISAALDAHPEGDFVSQVRELLSSASPSALVATTELLAANAGTDLAGALANEKALSYVVLREDDFVEGVRAVLVDKTRDAAFSPQPDPERYRRVLR